MRNLHSVLLLAAATAFSSCSGEARPPRIVIAATTSIEDTGLLDVIAAEFRRMHPEIEASTVAVGTGQAIELGRRGDADVLITHDSAAEMQLVREGIATERRSVMYNDFVIVGPPADPADARGSNAVQVLQSIAARGELFVSRGDDSGTHRRELRLWSAARIDPHGASWYLEAGVGMGDALLLASQKHAYILSDRATYVRFKPRLDLSVICESDPPLINNYGVIVINGKLRESAARFADWITSAPVQQMIGEFGRKEFGQSLFMPAARSEAIAR